tara:strand:- start:3959 stop:4234 length:276 start_codon:yes stop_codon:yes gene_type:complete
MDFLEDLEAYNSSMENAYNIVTKRMTIDDIYELLDSKEVNEFYLPFDPTQNDGRDEATLALLIDHFTESEEYEKCQELVNIKRKFLEAPKD